MHYIILYTFSVSYILFLFIFVTRIISRVNDYVQTLSEILRVKIYLSSFIHLFGCFSRPIALVTQ